MANKHQYLQEMAASGYNTDTIDDFHRLCLPYLADRYFPSKDSKIMDIGVGLGHCLLPLKAAGYRNLTAIDYDSFSCERLEQEGIQFFDLDIEVGKIPLQDAMIDGIISFHMIEHLKDPTNLINESFRLLKRGGHCLIVTPDWRKQYKTFWRDHTHVHPYDKRSIERLLCCFGFEIIRIGSFGCMRGIGSSGLWKIWPSLMFTGVDLIAVAKKP